MGNGSRLAILCALLAAGSGFAEESAPDIAWERGLQATLAKARRENRPILIAINALDGETGNQAMAFSHYRNRALVDATRPMLCLVANPKNHDKNGTCARFGSCDCRTHQAVLTYALRRWSDDGNLISPQHMILAPDGTLLWRKEFLISPAELQRECERAVLRTSPRRALDLAARTRARQLEELARGADPKVYGASADPLAPAVLLLMWSEDEDRKWLDAFRKSPAYAFSLLRLYLDEEPAFLKVAQALDKKRAAWWRKRLRAKPARVPPPHDSRLKRAFAALKKGDTSGLDALLAALAHPVDGPEVRAALADLAGVDHGPGPDGWKAQFGG